VACVSADASNPEGKGFGEGISGKRRVDANIDVSEGI